MTLTLKEASDIKAELAEGYAVGGITNFNAGGVANTQIEAIGDVARDLYVFGRECARAAAAPTSEDEYLEAIVAERGLTRQPAAKAEGTLYAGRNTPSASDFQVKIGDTFMTPKDLNGVRYRYVATENVTLLAGETEIAVSVEAEAVGAAYNVAVGQISQFARPISGFDWVENRTGWLTSEGADKETNDRLRQRYMLAWEALTTGSTPGAYVFWALDADERVAIAWVDPNGPRGRGTINLYILGTGGLPTDDLIDTVQAYIDDNRPAGSDVLVLSPAYKTVDITVKLVRYANTDASAIETTVRAALAAYFNPLGSELYDWIRPLGVGKKVVFSQLVEICTRPDEIYDAVFTTPTADVSVAADELPALGTVTVTHEEVVP